MGFNDVLDKWLKEGRKPDVNSVKKALKVFRADPKARAKEGVQILSNIDSDQSIKGKLEELLEQLLTTDHPRTEHFGR
jgi:hypothetical protein